MNAAAVFDRPSLAAPKWRRAFTFGVLWGIGVSAFAMVDLPLSDLSERQLSLLLVRLSIGYCLTGLLQAAAVVALEDRLTPMLVALLLIAMMTVGIAIEWILWQLMPSDLPSWGAEARHLHSTWFRLVYGGLFLTAYYLSVRAEQSRKVFAQAQIARLQSEAVLASDRVRALQGQIDPGFLLRAMVEVQRRYSRAPDGFQRLLDLLVGFLRAAMPGIRSGTSTLPAELFLTMRYAEVRAEIDPQGIGWTIGRFNSIPALPFPALLLLPLLDRLAAATNNGPVDLQIDRSDGRCTLTLSARRHGHGEWLAPDLLYRLQVGLRRLFDDSWTLTIRSEPEVPALILSLPDRTSDVHAPAAVSLFLDPQEALDG